MENLTKTEIKHKAQEKIIHGIQIAFQMELDEEERNEVLLKEMDKQFRRIEKLLGYEEGSCIRCV